jgi:hypothetical protein
MPIFGDPVDFSLVSRVVSSGALRNRRASSNLNRSSTFNQLLGQDLGALDMGQFQSGPFTAQQAESIYGAASEFVSPSGTGPGSRFLQEYQSFQEEYFRAISDKRNLGLGKTADPDIQRLMGKIDLTVLNYQEQQRLKGIFLNKVVQGSNLFNQVGLPGVMLPSANRYRLPFRFNTVSGSGDMHPAQVMLSRMVFNIDKDKVGMDAIGFNLSNIMTAERLQATTKQMTNLSDIFSNPAPGSAPKKIYTIDVETTGVFQGSQVRSMSIAEMNVGAVGEDAVRIIGEGTDQSFNVLFKSPQLSGYTVSNMNEGASTLNRHLARIEGATGARVLEMGDDGVTFLDESVKFLNKLMEADVVTGHNIGFDIDKMAETMMAMPGFHRHKDASVALGRFLEARNSGTLQVLDTLEIARRYLENEANAVLGAMDGLDEFQKSERIVRTLFSSEVLARVEIGGSASWASVENISLNTNLFELIHNKEGIAVAQNLLQGGAAHTSEVDVKLQSYIGKYIHTGELKFLRDPNSPTLAYNAQGIDAAARTFGDLMRDKTLKSLAVTPTTNIADITQLSDQMFERILNQDDLLRRVTIRGQAEQLLEQSAIPTFRGTTGTLGFSERLGRHIFSTDVPLPGSVTAALSAAGMDPDDIASRIDLSKVRSILQAARNNPLSTEAKMIQDFGFNISQMTSADQIASMGISSSVRAFQADDIMQMPAEELVEGLTALSTRFSPKRLEATYLKTLRSGLLRQGHDFNLFGATIPDIEDAALRTSFMSDLGRTMASVGSPFAGLVGVRDQIFSASMAQATSDVTRAAGEVARTELFKSDTPDPARLKSLMFTEYAKELSEVGISTFDAQKQIKMLERVEQGQTYKVLMDTDIAKKAMKNVFADQMGISEVGLSIAKGRMVDNVPVDTVNLVWHISRQLDNDQVERVALESLNILGERSALLSYGSEATDDVQRNLTMLEQLQDSVNRRGQPLELTDELRNNEIFSTYLKSIREKGIVIGSVQGETAQKIMAVLAGLNIPIENDVFLSKYTGSVLEGAGLSDRHIAVGTMYDRTSTQLAGINPADLMDASSRQLDRANLLAERLAQLGSGAQRDIQKRMSSRRMGDASSLADFYVSNKTNLKLGAVGLAAAAIGYYSTNKYQERQMYNESFEQQPYERGRQISSLNDYSRETYSFNQNRSDPLATAGVVGGLDRAKINHTSMNPYKNNHLFGGQL